MKNMKAYEYYIVRIRTYKNIWKCDVQCEMSHTKLWKHTSMDCEISTYGIIWKYIYMIWRHMKRNNIFENVYICLKYLWIVKVNKLQMDKSLLWFFGELLCGLVFTLFKTTFCDIATTCVGNIGQYNYPLVFHARRNPLKGFINIQGVLFVFLFKDILTIQIIYTVVFVVICRPKWKGTRNILRSLSG